VTGRALASRADQAMQPLRTSLGRRSVHRMKSRVICRSPDVMGGMPVFCGTRVPIETLLDYLEAGESIDDFLAGFPSVTREQVIQFLQETKERVIASTA